MSLAVCKAGAAEKGVPLYRHIADLAGNPEVILPVPVSAGWGRLSPGFGFSLVLLAQAVENEGGEYKGCCHVPTWLFLVPARLST